MQEIPVREMKFSFQSAAAFARRNKLGEWVHAYLNAGPRANPPLLEMLRRHHRVWQGPLLLPVGSFTRVLGPEPHMKYREEPSEWGRRVSLLEREIEAGACLPPIIAEARDGFIYILDGTHRHEAWRRRGIPHCWAVLCLAVPPGDASSRGRGFKPHPPLARPT